MANILILGGGLSGVAAAESLAENLASEHQITLVSRSSRFVSQPTLVGLAFGEHRLDDITHDLREAMHDRRIRFIKGEVGRVDPYDRIVTIAHGDISGTIHYDYLIFALGGRLATERIAGFFEYAHHPLTVKDALKFGEAIRGFKEGRAVIGYSPKSRFVLPVYETAFALSRLLEDRGKRGRAKISVVIPERIGDKLAKPEIGWGLLDALKKQNVDFVPDFSINRITASSVLTTQGDRIDYDLLMLLPALVGASPVRGMGIADADGFIRVEETMRVKGVERMYAVGDCVSFPGPKMSHMAVSQAEVAAANLAAEVEAHTPKAKYEHELMLSLYQETQDSILNKHFRRDGKAPSGRRVLWVWPNPLVSEDRLISHLSNYKTLRNVTEVMRDTKSAVRTRPGRARALHDFQGRAEVFEWFGPSYQGPRNWRTLWARKLEFI